MTVRPTALDHPGDPLCRTLCPSITPIGLLQLIVALWPWKLRLMCRRLQCTAMLDKDRVLCAGKLKVVVYEMTHMASSSESYNALSAHDLASADIVLTTYDTLRVDFHRIRDDTSTSYSFRRPKKYEVRKQLFTCNAF